MVEVVVLGTTGIDTVETPFGKAENVAGGSALYAAYAASFFAETGIVGIVGKDFPKKHLDSLEKKGIDLKGLEIAEGKSFSWKGKYGFDINVAETLETQINVLSDFNPKLPDEYREAEFVFLGNVGPELQLSVLSQMRKKPKLVVSDTMNYYIKREKNRVLDVVRKADIALMNDSEARQLFETPNLFKAARKILELDSDYAIIKKGEHGAIMVSKSSFFAIPGYPLENIVDPTGCGDCFGGALIG